MQLLTNYLLSLFSVLFLLHLSLSSPPSIRLSTSSPLPSSSFTDAYYDASFAEKTTSIPTEPATLECSHPLSCDTARTGQDKMTTAGDQMMAMEALKYSLGIPDRMHWNGDPCLPTSWEGVKCGPDQLGSNVILEIDVSDQCLTGFIAEEIRLLTNLNLLNVSKNQLSGPIPTDVYSIHLRGGKTSFSENKHLCGLGLPNTQQCSLLMTIGPTKKVIYLVLVLTVVGYACQFLIFVRDEDDPHYATLEPQLMFRVGVALGYYLFNALRLSILGSVTNTPDFDMRLAYYKWQIGVAADVLLGVMVGLVLVFLVLRFTRDSAKISIILVMLAITVLYVATLRSSIKSMQQFYQLPWFMIQEMIWMVSNYAFMNLLIRLQLTIDLSTWAQNVVALVRAGIHPLEWFDFAIITFFMYQMMALIYTVMAS